MSGIIEQANRDFREILLKLDDPPGSVKAEVDEMNEKLRQRRALAGPRVLPTFIKPFFLTAKMTDYFRRVVETVLRCQEKVMELYYNSPEHRYLFELAESEIPLVDIPHRISRRIWFSRLDAIMTEDSFKFLEMNCDSPGGAYYSDIQRDVLMEMKVFDELKKIYDFEMDVYRPKVLDTLLKAWEEFGGRTTPHIAVMGNPEVTNVEEFRLFAEYFDEKGYHSFFTDPWHLEYDGETLTSEGRRIDVIYRRGILADYSKHVEETRPVIQAYKEGKVCFVNPLSSKLGDNKSLLSVLTGDEMKELFTPEERTVLDKHIPWTRLVREGKTEYKGETVDLLEFIRKNKEMLVIKPNSEYGGKDVVIGPECEQSAWESTIEEGLSKPKAVQEYVPIPKEEFPVFEPELKFAPKKINTNFFSFAGKYGGGFCRTSDSSVINISAGGALVAFMVIKGKKA